MKNKLISLLILLLFFLYIFHLNEKLKTLNKDLKIKDNQLNSIFEKNHIYMMDLKNRNEELKIRNEELKEYQRQLENVDDDCLNRPINSNIVRLLQKAGM